LTRAKLETVATKFGIAVDGLSDEDYEKLREYASTHNLTITQVVLKGIKLLLSIP